jgi:tetratricopeptide (TPR) repeat protein
MRLWTAAEIFAIYLRLLLYPATLSADYSYRQVALIDGPNLAAVVGMCAAVGLCTGFAWAVRRRAPAIVFAIGFFAVAYSLVSNLLIPLQVLVAERLMYLPSVGFCVAVAYLWVVCSRRVQAAVSTAWLRRAPAALLAVILVLYSVRTFVRNLDWRDNRTLYAATVAASPDCFAAHFNYAAVLMRLPGQEATALHHLLRAYEIRQDHYPSLVNLSTLYLTLNEPEKAIEIAHEGLRVRPNGRELQAVLKAAEARLQQGAQRGK